MIIMTAKHLWHISSYYTAPRGPHRAATSLSIIKRHVRSIIGLIPLLARLIRYCLSISAHALPTCSISHVFSSFCPPSTLLELSSRYSPDNDRLPGRTFTLNKFNNPGFHRRERKRERERFIHVEESICFVFLQKSTPLINGCRNVLPTFSVTCYNFIKQVNRALQSNTSFVLLLGIKFVYPLDYHEDIKMKHENWCDRNTLNEISKSNSVER